MEINRHEKKVRKGTFYSLKHTSCKLYMTLLHISYWPELQKRSKNADLYSKVDMCLLILIKRYIYTYSITKEEEHEYCIATSHIYLGRLLQKSRQEMIERRKRVDYELVNFWKYFEDRTDTHSVLRDPPTFLGL